MKSGKISRGHFIKKLWGLALLPYALFALLAAGKNRQLYSRQKMRIPDRVPMGVSFFGDVIVVNAENRIRVFSSHCTHLGCLINKVEENELLCPCHGSAFSADGSVIRGPAAEKLKSLNFRIDKKTHEIVIDL